MLYLFIFTATLTFFYKLLLKKSNFFRSLLMSLSLSKPSSPPLVAPLMTENLEGNNAEERKSESPVNIISSVPESQYQRELGTFALTSADFKDLSHFYKNSSTAGENPRKTKRITSELKQLANHIPIYPTNSIFLAYDDKNLDIMKAIITGADDTPYSHGVFLFDIYFDSNYPSTPPKINLMTTGGDTIRFNPNLYANGYVCLSLIGTWSGGPNENWNEKSNLLQVLMSIQSLVMIDGVLYNEPSYQNGRMNGSNKALDTGYTNIVKYANVKYAIGGYLKEGGPKPFSDIVKKHFYFKRTEIKKTMQKWLKEAEEIKDGKVAAEYGSLVLSHNYTLASTFAKGREIYFEEMKKEVEIVEILLDKLEY